MGNRAMLAGLVLLSACGGSSPTAPSPPVQQPPMPRANVEVIVQEALDYTSFNPSTGWTFAGKARNTGQGCAASVRGTAQFRDAAGTMLQSVDLALDPAKRLQPNEVVDWQGCCLTEANGKNASGVRVSFTWQDVAC